MNSFEIIAAGEPCGVFDYWVETLNRTGIQAKVISIADYDREQGYAPAVHPRKNEAYVLVPTDRLEEALNLLKGLSK